MICVVIMSNTVISFHLVSQWPYVWFLYAVVTVMHKPISMFLQVDVDMLPSLQRLFLSFNEISW